MEFDLQKIPGAFFMVQKLFGLPGVESRGSKPCREFTQGASNRGHRHGD